MVSPGTTGGSRSGELRLSAIGEAWAEVQKNLGTWVGAALIYLLINGALNGVDRALEDDSPALSFVVSLISLVVSAFLSGGMYLIALKQLRGESSSIGDLFGASASVPALVGATVLATIAIILGLILCIVPGLILAGLFMFYTLLIVDKRVGVLDSLTQSFNALRPHIGGVIIYILAIVGINILGLLACVVGLLVTVPVTYLSTTILYREFFHGNSTMSGDTNLFPPLPTIPTRPQ